MASRNVFKRIHINVTCEQYEFLAARAFVLRTSMSALAREVIEDTHKRELKAAAAARRRRES
jgi:hypothetical protein